jgi:hypothetical protein
LDAPHVVYHVAAMGDWQDVVREQLCLLRDSGLDRVRLTHVGGGRDWLLAEAARRGVDATLVRSDPNTDHYETFAVLEAERLAKAEQTARPVLYLHTKGVSAPGHPGKARWRWLMGEHVVRRWRENVAHLADHDAVGVNWWRHGEQHFSGNFWLARPDWLRRLPDFAGYHAAKDRVRYSCEMWIGAARWCRAKSLVCADEPFWHDGYDFDRWGTVTPDDSAGRVEYNGLVAQQSAGVFDAFPDALAELRPARVLEVGTGHGGFAVFLRHALNDLGLYATPVVTVDTTDRPGYHAVRGEGVDVRVEQVFSPAYAATAPWVGGYVAGPGPTLVLCDGDDRAGEFGALAAALKSGDVIMAHDYAPDAEYLRRHAGATGWRWLEFTDADAAAPAARHGLTAWRQDAMLGAHWLSMRKTAPGAPAPPRSPDVTVCVPTIPPRRRQLLRALESIETQALRPAETLVRYDYRGEGAAATRSRALRDVRTAWVAFLDDDDEMYPDHLRELWDFARQTGADYVFSYFDVRAEDGTVRNDWDPLRTFGREFDPASPHQTTITILVRTELARAAGFSRPPAGLTVGGQAWGEDYQFTLDCVRLGATVRHLAKRTWAWHHWSGNTSGVAAQSPRRG